MIKHILLIFFLLSTQLYAETIFSSLYSWFAKDTKPKTAESDCSLGTGKKTIICPSSIEGQETTLSSIDYKKGTYTCKYADKAGVLQYVEKPIKCMKKINTGSVLFEDEEGLTNNIRSYSQAIFPKGDNKSDHFIGSTELGKKLNTTDIAETIKELSQKEKKTNFSKEPIHLNSHSHSDKTIGGIIIGAFTLDPDFFVDGYVNSLGELELKDKYKNVELSSTEVSLWNYLKTNIGKINPFSVDYDSLTKAGKANTVDPLSFVDRQVLGYLAYFGISFKQAYQGIINLVFSMGIMWSFGYYMFKKGMTIVTKKDDFNVNKTSWLLSASIAIAFFVAPVVNDGELTKEMQDNIYQPTDIKQEQEYQNFSTPAQELLRQSLQQGNYFGNLASDYATFAYLKFMSYKQGMMDNAGYFYKSTLESIKDINRGEFALNSNLEFYLKVCRPYFPEIEYSMTKHKDTAQKENMYHPDTNKVLEKNGIESQRLDYQACVDLENRIQTQTNGLIKKIDTLRSSANGMLVLYNGDADAKKDFERYLHTMEFVQNRFGWVDAPVIPISYFFFRNAGYFSYNEKLEDRTNPNVFKESVENYRENDLERGVFQKASESIGNAAVNGLSYTIENTFWLVVPGFKNIYDTISDNLVKLYISKVDLYNKGEEGFAKRSLRRAISALLGVVKRVGKIPAAKAISIAAGVGQYLVSGKKSAIVPLIIKTFSLFVAATLMLMITEAITITAIAVFLAIKVALYLAEILFLYFVTPAIGLFYAMMNNGQSKNFVGHYFKNVALLSITPTLFVLITSLIIIVSEFLDGFFNGLIGLFTAVLQTGSQDLYSSSDAGFLDILSKTISLSMVQGISAIFTHFSTLAIATIMIFNFKGWFTKLAGIDGASEIMKEGGTEIKQNVNKYVNPVG